MKKIVLIITFYFLVFCLVAKAQEQKVLVIINSSIYSDLQSEVLRYVNDISREYKAELFETSGGTAENLKDFIKNQSDSLVGCVLIGSMPSCMFEIENDLAAFRPTEFPCDLFFMDLDGSWSDLDNDGKYDSHTDGTGDVAPEIFIGRIDASLMSPYGSNQINDLRNYFNRDHNYWSGAYGFRKTGLAYTDVDWKDYTPVNEEMQYLYGLTNYQLIKDDRISGKDYLENRLQNDQYEFIQVAAHSSQQAHWFNFKGGVSPDDIRNISPRTIGYNLFACSACDYTYYNFLGGAYIFNNSEKSLVVVGSTKIGSMLLFYAFYKPLGENKCIGMAYKDWFDYLAPYDDYEKSWHYGMTILGDPLIKFNSGDGNHGPLVDAGSRHFILWPDSTLEVGAKISDDGLPCRTCLTWGWEKVSGPGDVVFENKNAVSTAVHLNKLGDYKLKFSASDGEYIAEDFKDIKIDRVKWMGETNPPIPGKRMGIIVRDSLAYLSTNANLNIINVADKTNPHLINACNFQETIDDPYYNNLDIDSNYAYVVLSEKGLHIFNISNCYNLYQTGSFSTHDTLGKANDVKVIGEYAYVADNVRGLMVLDIHDRTDPKLLGYCPTDGTADALSIQGDYAYIADGSNGLRIISISDKNHPEEVGHFNNRFDHTYFREGIQVLGNFAYVSYNDYDRYCCISIIDISDKTKPFEVSHLDRYYKGFYVEGNYLYYFGTADYDVLGIYDITDKSNPILIESYHKDEVYFQNLMNIFKYRQYIYILDNLYDRGLNILKVSLDNTCPYVYAGDDRKTYRSKISLQGMASDDQLPDGSSLSWSWQKISGPGNATFFNPDKANTQVHFSDSGTYVLRLSVSDGVLTGYDDIRIINFSAPPTCNNVEVCEGDSVPALTASGDSIRWYSDSLLTDLLHTGNQFASGKSIHGLYPFYVTQIIEGIESDYRRVELSITPLPSIMLGEDTTITRDQHIMLGPYNNRFHYIWYDGSVNPYIDISANEIGPGNHTISVLVTDTNTCRYLDSLTVQVVFPTNTGNTEIGIDLILYPNPADKLLNIKISDFPSEDIVLNLFNQEGELLKNIQTSTDNSGTIMPINISDLPPGIYYIKLITPKKQFLGKVNIQ
jgi:hypothetical protein